MANDFIDRIQGRGEPAGKLVLWRRNRLRASRRLKDGCFQAGSLAPSSSFRVVSFAGLRSKPLQHNTGSLG